MTENAIIVIAICLTIALCCWANAWSDRGPRVIERKCECKHTDKNTPTTEKRL